MKKRGVFEIQLAIAVVVIMILLGSCTVLGEHIVKNIKIDDLKSQCFIIDHALETWSASHKTIQNGSIVYSDNKVIYVQQRLYPKTLTELGDLQNMGFSPKKIDLSKFRYVTQNEYTAYHLEVTLPDGTIYKSLQSTY